MEPQRLIGPAVNTDDHRGRYVGRLEDSAPLRDQLTVTGEHDCLGRICRDVHGDLPATVVIERPGHDLSRRSLVMHDRNLRSAHTPDAHIPLPSPPPALAAACQIRARTGRDRGSATVTHGE